MSFLFGNAHTYAVDQALFTKLGFKEFSISDQDEHFVGEYKIPGYDTGRIKVWVTCMPAMFWRFEIETIEGYKYRVETGSGSLSEYWRSCLQVAEGMLTMTQEK